MQADVEYHAERLQMAGATYECPPVAQHLTERELLGMIHRFDAIIAGDDEVTAKVLEHGQPRLRVVSKWGVGIDGIDIVAASRLGIKVTNTPGAFDDEVADVVIGYLILLLRGLHRIDRAVHAGGWLKVEGRSTSSLTLGVIGLGGIGRAVVRRARVLGMEVVASDPLLDPSAGPARSNDSGRRPGRDDVEIVELDALLTKSDVISLNCPLTSSTYHLLSAREFSRMKVGSYLINTSRGKVVDQPSLVDALSSGKLAGVALDVFEHEPLPIGDPIRSFENVILGSHNASNTREAVRRTSVRALDNALRGLGLQ